MDIEVEVKKHQEAAEAAAATKEADLAAVEAARQEWAQVKGYTVSEAERLQEMFDGPAHRLQVAGVKVKPLIEQGWVRPIRLYKHAEARQAQGRSGPGFPEKV